MVSVLSFIHRAGTKYSVAVFGMFDGGESRPLDGEEKTTLSDAPESPHLDVSGIISAHHKIASHLYVLSMHILLRNKTV